MRPAFILVAIILITGAMACSGKLSVKTSDEQAAVSAAGILHKAMKRYDRGCLKDALENFYRAHELFTLADDLEGVAVCMNNMGNIYRHSGDIPGAVSFFEESFRLYSIIGDNNGAAQALSNQAAMMTQSGNLENASALLDKAAVLSPAGSKSRVAVLNNRAVLLMRQQDYSSAEEVLMQALNLVSETDPANFATVNASLGNLMRGTGRHQEARWYFQRAYEADKKRGYYRGMADDLSALADIQATLGDTNAAVDFLQRSVKIYALTGDAILTRSLFEKLVALAEGSGRDITVTSHFVKKWLQGDTATYDCR